MINASSSPLSWRFLWLWVWKPFLPLYHVPLLVIWSETEPCSSPQWVPSPTGLSLNFYFSTLSLSIRRQLHFLSRSRISLSRCSKAPQSFRLIHRILFYVPLQLIHLKSKGNRFCLLILVLTDGLVIVSNAFLIFNRLCLVSPVALHYSKDLGEVVYLAVDPRKA